MADSDLNNPILVNNRTFVKGILKEIKKECEETNWQNILYAKTLRDISFSFAASSEISGTGCCGITPIYNLRYLYPQYNNFTGKVDWLDFRQKLKEFFYGLHLFHKQKSEESASTKIISVSLTHRSLKDHPYGRRQFCSPASWSHDRRTNNG